MGQKTMNAWLLFFAAATFGLQALGTWYAYQQLQSAGGKVG